MTPEIQQQLNELQRRVTELENVTNTASFAELFRRLGGVSVSVVSGASTTGTTISVRDFTDTTSELVADDYDGVLTLTDTQGNSYRIGYYS